MNQEVTVTGMSVTAKSDQIFLMIKAGEYANADDVQDAGLTNDTALNSSAVLLPVAHHGTNSSAVSYFDTESNWYWQTSNNPGSSAAASGEHAVGSGALGDYVLTNTFTLTVADGSNYVKDLKVANIKIIGTDAQAVKVVVATENASEEFSNTSSSGTAGSVVLRAANLTDETVQVVKVYIYWDGNDDDVYTNNIGHLLNTTVEVTFTGTVEPRA